MPSDAEYRRDMEGPRDCETCGAELEGVDCWNCDGEGTWHDCGEDCCNCRYPETMHRRRCPECKGRGYFMLCPEREHHGRPTLENI